MMDSGIGGLSVWREVKALLPEESIVFFGDGKNCPYGGKPIEELRGYVEDAVKQLLDRGAKLIVLACNTATAVAIEYLRSHYDIPFVGMEPAVKPAALQSKSGVIGILATKSSLEGELFHNTSARYGDKVKIISAVGEKFVELVENSKIDSPEALAQVRKVLQPLIDAGADEIVLGCTHYPFLAERMKEVIGGRDIHLVDPSHAVAERVKFLLEKYGLSAEHGHVAEYEFMTAADEEYAVLMEQLSRKL